MGGITEKYIANTGIAGAIIPAGSYGLAIKIDPATDHGYLIAGAGDFPTGVLVDNESKIVGEEISIANKPGDLVACVAGVGGAARGQKMKPGAGGKWIGAAVSGDDFYIVAQTVALADEKFSGVILPGKIT